MRQSSRTPKRRIILSILHSSRLPSITYRTHLYPKSNRNSKLFINSILNYTPSYFLKHYPFMTSMYDGLYSKNTPIWTTPMITKSPCRSSHCRLNSPRSSITKIRRLWYITHHNLTRTSHWLHSISLYNTLSMRYNYN